MASGTLAETERVIREKLEASGQYGKMRAMIMEAALQTVSASDRDDSGAHQPLVFHPTVALADAKRNGITELSIVQEYLEYLGLQYTARVLQLEAGLQGVPLRTSEELQQQLHIAANNQPGPCLSALVHGGATGLVQSTPATEAPAAAAGKEGTKAEEEVADAASDHHQPGGENTTYFISKWKKRHFVRHNQVSGQQLQIEYLTDCHTVVLDELDSMTVDDCEGGELVIAACEGSVFLRGCKNMTVHVACKQLRTRDCEHINLHIFTSTDPVVEMSHHISFYPFHLRLPGLQRLFAEARLDPKANRFVHVYDFTPTEPQLPTPHFEVHFPEHHLLMEDRYASYGAPECPPEIEALLALRLMPAASSESGKNKSYDIRTGAQLWAQAGPTAVPTVAAAAAVGAATATSANAHAESSDDEEDEEDEETGSDSDQAGFSAPQSSSASTASSSKPEEDVPAKKRVAAESAMQRIGGLSTAPSLGPTPTLGAAAHTDTRGGIDKEEYSSFDDGDDDSNADDKYDVEEDEDDF
ncbi:conserved hypothetical protein [Leishmania mexicana MHOM/GT/2001/U1103]|uniref:C-CAP/cofactor C-like domain-containing protein n=1 Tax=Leishmania mexicana (strain MHOM/GT/2001/U1103) TaxID=929439 RepID=E9ARJ0_LEIMU|nr:conserved hypothetical protein [Leishmania mexicana MHOM/GT/2001/U1103]CBZ25561.1 conserved hypothetical protein [Leishmania mexicana MHOM/GT/2001/U1103]